jgi:hypothetical protein
VKALETVEEKAAKKEEADKKEKDAVKKALLPKCEWVPPALEHAEK